MTQDEIIDMWHAANGVKIKGAEYDAVATFAQLVARRAWVGLTEEERDGKRVFENGLLFNTAEVQVWEMAVEWAEQKLKERNT